MFGLETDEQKNDIEKDVKQLEAEIAAAEKQSKEHLNEVGLSLEEIKEYIENPNNFSQKNWEFLQSNIKDLDDRLAADLANIADPKKTKQTYQEHKKTAPHWLPTR